MSDSYKVYRTIHSSLQKSWEFDPSKRQHNGLNILTGFICGIIQSKSVKLANVAGEIPGSGKEESQIMQLRRWLKNEKVSVDLFYLPFITTLIHCLAKQTLVLAIDGSTTAQGCITLMVSMIYKGRSLPLVWVTRKGKKGHFPQDMHIELIKSVQAIIPDGTKVICLGDGEFDGADWLETISGYGWEYACRTANNAILYENGEEFTFKDICPEQGGMTEISELEFTRKRSIVVRAVVYWGKKYKDPIYLVTNFPTGGEAFNWYRKRFRIETLFSDLKGRGFNLQKSGLRGPERVSRLIIAAALAYIWMVYLGELALNKGWDKTIHRTDRCDLSLFTLGVRVLKRCLREEIALPKFCLILSGKALL
ncbi:MAG: IS4 family transposase [Methyloprofundus sp.]|nr:IS4 family transposase [Methyloprofundus sp.]